MDKRGEGGSYLGYNIVFFVIEAVVFITLIVYLVWFQQGIGLTEDFYAKEMTRLVNQAKPGDAIEFDVTEAVRIADDRGVSRSDVFTFNNPGNAVEVKLSGRTGTVFRFLNEVDIVNYELDDSAIPGRVIMKFDVANTEVEDE